MRKHLATAVAAVSLAMAGQAVYADINAAKKWIDSEFQPSALNKQDQIKEMEWFIQAAEPFRGMEINVLSETIPTHTYESEVLTKAFEEITGIKVITSFLVRVKLSRRFRPKCRRSGIYTMLMSTIQI